MKRVFETGLDFLRRHERPFATFLFITGFGADLLSFGLLDLPAVIALFAVYLGLVVLGTLLAHITYDKREGSFTRALAVLAPLSVQFLLGSLLSGFVIFYTKSAVLSVSWPFIILLIGIFFGNEVFRNYREHLIFQTLLIYFSLYAFIIFALPLFFGKLGTQVFIESTILSLTVFGVYVAILGVVGWRRLKSALKSIIATTLITTLIIVGSYLGGLLPPIPLTLKAGGIYYSITHKDGNYVAEAGTQRSWWDWRAPVVQHVPGTPLYAYSSVFAPGDFTASVVHVWQHKDKTSGSWSTKSVVAFTVSGGRSMGYRGYSQKDDPEPGEWRVRVQTTNGQTIGEFYFTVENNTAPQTYSVQNL